MSKRILLSVACLVLFAGIVLAAGEVAPAAPALLSAETGPACQVDSAAAALTQLGFQPVYRGHDPATCGRCLHCKSTTACAGRLLGDLCNNDGSTCQAFDGCALYNCCRCSNEGTGSGSPKAK